MGTTDHENQPKGKTVLIVSLVLAGAFGLRGVIQPMVMTESAPGVVNYALSSLGWLFLVLCTAFLALAAYLAFGPYGPTSGGKKRINGLVTL